MCTSRLQAHLLDTASHTIRQPQGLGRGTRIAQLQPPNLCGPKYICQQGLGSRVNEKGTNLCGDFIIYLKRQKLSVILLLLQRGSGVGKAGWGGGVSAAAFIAELCLVAAC